MSLRIAALGLLAQHPGSGYDLLKRFEVSMANVWPATQSQLYGELNRLARDGLIEVSDVGPRGRKEYRVTDAGRAELLHWITHPGDDPALRRPDLLRVFMLGQIPVDQACPGILIEVKLNQADVTGVDDAPGITRIPGWAKAGEIALNILILTGRQIEPAQLPGRLGWQPVTVFIPGFAIIRFIRFAVNIVSIGGQVGVATGVGTGGFALPDAVEATTTR